MKILLTGANGLLGSDLKPALNLLGHVTGVDLCDFDITNRQACFDCLLHLHPELVVHAAAFTQVDACESMNETAFLVNGGGTGNIAAACESIGARMVYFSSDYVFDGESSHPYIETDSTNPSSVYARSKLAGELLCKVEVSTDKLTIIRTSWLFGAHGKNFVDTIINRAQNGCRLNIIKDQTGCPTYAPDLAAATMNLIKLKARGIFHVCNSDPTTWYDFACFFLNKMNLHPDIRAVSTPEYPLPAKRPAFSVMSTKKYSSLTGHQMPSWTDAVVRHLVQKYGISS